MTRARSLCPHDSDDHRRRIAVVITNRASYARIKSVLEAIQDHPELRLVLILGASMMLDRYGSAAAVVEGDGFEIDAQVYMILEGENPLSMAKTTGLGIVEMTTVLDNLAPDMVLTVADRFETIATAVAASYMNIPLAHVQGGELTGSIDDRVRHAVTKLSNLHFVANRASARRVLQMGEMPDAVFVTGCPSIDLARRIAAEPPLTNGSPEVLGGVGATVSLSEPYAVVVQHPVTTEYGEAREQVEATLEAVTQVGVPALWFWPNPDAGADLVAKGLRVFRERGTGAALHFVKNLPPEVFLRIVDHATCLVGNSSAGIREGSFLGVPVVNIGDRQEGRERGPNVIDVPYVASEIAAAMRHQIAACRYPSSDLYGDGSAGTRIASLLAEVEPRIDKRFYTAEAGAVSDLDELAPKNA